MTTFNESMKPLTADELAAVVIPEFERTFVKQQPAGERKFAASGAKADVIIRYLLIGGYTRDQIAFFVDASPSRVGEVMWAMDAAKVAYPPLARQQRAKAEEPAVEQEPAAPAKPKRKTKAA